MFAACYSSQGATPPSRMTCMSDVSAPSGTSTSLLLMKKYSWLLFFQCRYAYDEAQTGCAHTVAMKVQQSSGIVKHMVLVRWCRLWQCTDVRSVFVLRKEETLWKENMDGCEHACGAD